MSLFKGNIKKKKLIFSLERRVEEKSLWNVWTMPPYVCYETWLDVSVMRWVMLTQAISSKPAFSPGCSTAVTNVIGANWSKWLSVTFWKDVPSYDFLSKCYPRKSNLSAVNSGQFLFLNESLNEEQRWHSFISNHRNVLYIYELY